jgi:hypothetical protein
MKNKNVTPKVFMKSKSVLISSMKIEPSTITTWSTAIVVKYVKADICAIAI